MNLTNLGLTPLLGQVSTIVGLKYCQSKSGDEWDELGDGWDDLRDGWDELGDGWDRKEGEKKRCTREERCFYVRELEFTTGKSRNSNSSRASVNETVVPNAYVVN